MPWRQLPRFDTAVQALGLRSEGQRPRQFFAPHIANPVARYGLAVAVAVAGCALRVVADPFLGNSGPFVFGYLAAVFSAWMGGFGPGLLTTLLSAGLSIYLFAIGDRHVLASPQWVLCGVYVVTGALVSLFTEALRAERAYADGVVRERSRAFRELNAQTMRLEALVANIPGVVWETRGSVERPFERTVFVSESVERLTGFPAKGWLAIPDFWLIASHPDDGQMLIDAARVALRTGEGGQRLHRWVTLDGATVWVETFYAPYGEGTDAPAGLRGVTMDVTARREAELARDGLFEQARAAHERADEAARSKDRFLATLSHELRNPLNAISTWTHLLQNQEPDEREVERGLQAIASSTQALTQLVDDLLDLARMGAGKLQINLAPVTLAELVESACESVTPAATSKGVELDCEVGNLPPLLLDAQRIRQVVWNLLSNAVKFTPRGGRVELRVHAEGSRVLIAVKDTGVGIEPAFLSQVFAPFRQSDNSTARRYQGLGLGLTIARELVELHGGTVKAASPGLGLGATFTVSLPVAATLPVTAAAPSPRAQELAGRRIVVVDDEPAGRAALISLLRLHGARVEGADSAPAGFDLCVVFRPEVVLTDIEMPNEDGYSLAERLRRDGDGLATVPVVAVTGFASPQDRERALRAGFSEHLAKPVEPGRLLDLLVRLVGTSRDDRPPL